MSGTLRPFFRSLEVAEILYNDAKPLKLNDTFIFQMWFVLCESALEDGYAFKNPQALAAATEYMYKSSRMKNITKKEIAKYYEVSPSNTYKICERINAIFATFR